MRQPVVARLKHFTFSVHFGHQEQSVSHLTTMLFGGKMMAMADSGGHPIDDGLLDLIRTERAKALSAREWKFRLAGYGLAIEDVQGDQVVMRLPQRTTLGILPAGLS
jgi:hypothetical protein